MRHYAHACERVFSPDGWSLVGEAGVFTDPFYSPGSDFIAIGNECAADLIVRTARGEDVRDRAEAFNTNYLRLFEAFLRLYSGQYPLMGNAQVMTAKAAWDNGAYWAITGLLYFQRRFTNTEFMRSIDPLMRRFFVLHARMQQLFNAWDLADQPQYRGRIHERRERGLPARASGEPGGAADGRRDAAAEARGQLHAARSIRRHVAGPGHPARSVAGALCCDERASSRSLPVGAAARSSVCSFRLKPEATAAAVGSTLGPDSAEPGRPQLTRP